MPSNRSQNELLSAMRSYNTVILRMLNLYSRQTLSVEPLSTRTISTQSESIPINSSTSSNHSTLQNLLQTFVQSAIGGTRTEQTGTDTEEEEEPVISFLFDIPPQYSASSNIPRYNRVPARLTQRQILDKTNVFSFSENSSLSNTTCPITHSEFKVGDVLCEIKQCHHTFQYTEIMKWLDINTTCPVCRTHLLSETI